MCHSLRLKAICCCQMQISMQYRVRVFARFMLLCKFYPIIDRNKNIIIANQNWLLIFIYLQGVFHVDCNWLWSYRITAIRRWQRTDYYYYYLRYNVFIAVCSIDYTVDTNVNLFYQVQVVIFCLFLMFFAFSTVNLD